ncbi:MAG: hypothetical protein C4530_00190 [Desulfobacteraceae bacterium]|nr:MAG: hypothetical protein C4530_00190 [Desulfobacteraceae bacterium]
MKQHRQTHVDLAETTQLILLANLYGQRASEKLFFQGGTAIRWCYGGSRFSEDLDFETHLNRDEILDLVDKSVPGVRRDLTANLGPGKFELQTKHCREPLCVIWTKFSPENIRGKIAVKLEFQRSRSDLTPETQLLIFGASPVITERIQSGRLKTRDNAILTVETLPEILAGKVRALLERENYKGRDFWDIWYLGYSRQVKLHPEILPRKLQMYPFTLRRSKSDILRAVSGDRDSESVIKAITDDLKRFVPGRTYAVLEKAGFAPLMDAVREVLADVPEDIR